MDTNRRIEAMAVKKKTTEVPTADSQDAPGIDHRPEAPDTLSIPVEAGETLAIPVGDGDLTDAPKKGSIDVLERKEAPGEQPAILNGIERVFEADDLAFSGYREQTRLRIQQLLDRLAGQSLPDLETKRRITARIREQLRRAQLCVECPRCGAASALNCAASGTSRRGLYQFNHAAEKEKTHSVKGDDFPQIQVIDLPPRDGPAGRKRR